MARRPMKVKLSVTRSSQSQRLVPGLHPRSCAHRLRHRHRHRHRHRPRAHLRPRQSRPFRYGRRIDFSGAFTRDYRLVGDARSITRIVMATEIASATRYHHVPSNCQCSAPALHPLPLCSRPALTSHSCLAHPLPHGLTCFRCISSCCASQNWHSVEVHSTIPGSI